MACRHDHCPCEGLWYVYPAALFFGGAYLAITWLTDLPLPFVAIGIPLVCPPIIVGALFCSLPHAYFAWRKRRDYPRAIARSSKERS